MPTGNYGINDCTMKKKLGIRGTVKTNDAEETKNLGQLLAQELKGGEVLALLGNLGSGKTTFIKGLAQGLGIKHVITSPTFVLMKVYPVKRHHIRQLVHIDCYRVAGRELSKIGLGDYLNEPHTVVAIEWAEKLKHLPKMTIPISFQHGKKLNLRTISWRAS